MIRRLFLTGVALSFVFSCSNYAANRAAYDQAKADYEMGRITPAVLSKLNYGTMYSRTLLSAKDGGSIVVTWRRRNFPGVGTDTFYIFVNDELRNVYQVPNGGRR